MRSCLIVLLSLLFVALPCSTSAQQKRSTTPPDEILFTSSEYRKVPGWRLAYRGSASPDGKNVLVYYDVARMKRNGPVIQAWTKHVEKKGQDVISQLLSLNEYNCVSRKHRRLQMTEYDPAGQATPLSSEPSEWEYVLPDSMGERVLNVICLKMPDTQEEEMRAAAKFFQLARQEEKRGLLKQAKKNYLNALFYGGTNDKIMDALIRLGGIDLDPK